MNKSSIGTLQQATGDIYNVQQGGVGTPVIEVSTDTNISNLASYNEVNIYTVKRSLNPLIILECTFDGILTNHSNKRLDDHDVFHFDTIKRENIKDGYEPLFSLKVREQTGEEFLFKSKLLIKLFGNRYDLMVTGDETIEALMNTIIPNEQTKLDNESMEEKMRVEEDKRRQLEDKMNDYGL
jgi:hypothetical protein